MNRTPIEWTTFSANPLKYRDARGNVVWGCVHASPGCQHCYSEAIAKRYDRGGPFSVSVMNGLTPFLDEVECRKMRTARTIGGLSVAGSRCFLGDMTDIFGEWVPAELLHELFSNVLEVRTDVTWQILTKRAQRMHDYLWWRWGGRIPPRHIHIGVSVENQEWADVRIPLLLQTPAAVRFISAEPLLGPVDLRLGQSEGVPTDAEQMRERQWLLGWVIVGGESGPKSRSCDLEWIRSIVQQCQVAGVPVFVKQLGQWPSSDRDENQHGGQYWVRLYEKNSVPTAPPLFGCEGRGKKGDPSEWPEDLRIREFPSVKGAA
jgi:protein gp37